MKNVCSLIYPPIPLAIGSLIEGVINAKHDDYLTVLVQSKYAAILPLIQLNDDSESSQADFHRLQIGDNVTCVVLEYSNEKIILSRRFSFITNRFDIPRTTQSIQLNMKTYGYVKETTDNGSIVNFFGEAFGFLPGHSLTTGETVYVEVIETSSIPILKMLKSKNLDFNYLQNRINELLETKSKYHPGNNIYFSELEDVNASENGFNCNIEDGWTLNILPTFNGSLPKYVNIIYADINKRIYYGFGSSPLFTSDPPLAFRAICVEKCGSVSILRYKQWYFIAKSDPSIEVGSYAYAFTAFETTEHDIIIQKIYCADKEEFTLHFCLIVSPNKKYIDNSVEHTIRFLYKDWAVCTGDKQNKTYLIHRTQLKKSIYPGMKVYGSHLYLNGANLIISNKELPLFYEDCSPGKIVNASLVHFDSKGKNHLAAISPFVECVLKEKKMKSVLFDTYKCSITKHEGNKVCCSMKDFVIQTEIKDYNTGLFYTVSDESHNYILDVTDCCDKEFYKELSVGEKIEVFKFDDERVSYIAPIISYQHIRTMDTVVGCVFKIERDKIHVHITRDIDGVIPAEYYTENFETMGPLTPPDKGQFIQCSVLNIDADQIILSARNMDCLSYYNRRFFKATVTGITNGVSIFVDTKREHHVLDKKLYDAITEKPVRNIDDDELSLGKSLFVKHTRNKENPYIITSMIYPEPCFEFYDDQSEDDIYIPLSDPGEYDTDNHDNSPIPEPQNEKSFSEIRLIKQIKEKKKKMTDELNKPYNADINELRPVLYRSYAAASNIKAQNLPPLMHYLRTHDKLDNIDLLSYKTNISSKTLRIWHDKIKNDANWSPLIWNKIPTRKAMDDLLEDSIMYYIYTNFLAKGFQFNDRMCKSIALQFWEQHPSHRLAEHFVASSRWIKRFKEKYMLVNRRVHYHRRPKITSENAEACRGFYRELVEIYRKHKESNTLHYLINVDETAWKVCDFGDLTWASKGSEHVEFTGDFNEKDMITAIAAISASKEYYKLPLCLIKKGKTDRAARVFDEIRQYFQIEVSSSGWSTVSCFANYLIWLRYELNERYKNLPGYTQSQEIDLVLDLYASHRNNKIKELAKKLNFKLHYIPAGFTDAFQPLDRYVFGALKSMARAEFYREYALNPSNRHTMIHACHILLNCWARVSEETLSKAWNPYSDPRDDEVDSLINRNSFSFLFEGEPLTIRSNVKSIEMPAIIPDEFDDDSIEDGTDDIALDMLNESSLLTEDIVLQMKEVIAYETMLMSTHYIRRIVKPIVNNWETCNANTTIQVLSVIPGIREQLSFMKNSGRMDNDKVLKAIFECIKEYDKKDNILDNVPELPIMSCIDLLTDACENINHMLKSLNYGLIAEDSSVTSTIELIPDEYGMISVCDTLDNMIGKCNYTFNKVIAFRKEQSYTYNFDDIFKYGKYVFVLKMVVCNVTDTHFYPYIRDSFSSEFYLVNDARIKMASKEQVDESPTVLGIYYIFEHDEVVTNEGEKVEADVSIQPLSLSDDIQKTLNDIEYTEKRNRPKKTAISTERNERVPISREYISITPHTRITIDGLIENMGEMRPYRRHHTVNDNDTRTINE